MEEEGTGSQRWAGEGNGIPPHGVYALCLLLLRRELSRAPGGDGSLHSTAF